MIIIPTRLYLRLMAAIKIPAHFFAFCFEFCMWHVSPFPLILLFVCFLFYFFFILFFPHFYALFSSLLFLACQLIVLQTTKYSRKGNIYWERIFWLDCNRITTICFSSHFPCRFLSSRSSAFHFVDFFLHLLFFSFFFLLPLSILYPVEEWQKKRGLSFLIFLNLATSSHIILCTLSLT